MERLEGKVAIVTGAGTDIGEAIAHKFAKLGAIVSTGSEAGFNGLADNTAYVRFDHSREGLENKETQSLI